MSVIPSVGLTCAWLGQSPQVRGRGPHRGCIGPSEAHSEAVKARGDQPDDEQERQESNQHQLQPGDDDGTSDRRQSQRV